MMLGDLGARVIKVEPPFGGDESRGWGPPFVTPESGAMESTYFLSANRNKESIVLDLKDAVDRNTFAALMARADILIENFRPGTLARLGFGAGMLAELNSGLITLSISGFGHDGPEAQRAGYDQIAQGEGGLMSLTGSGPDDPQKVGVPICDLLAGIYGAFGVVAAVADRVRTGVGQVVRTSLLAAAVGVHAFQGSAWTVAGQVGQAAGNHHPSIAPYGSFQCNDGSVQLACGNASAWERLCAVVGLDPRVERFATNVQRVAHRDELIQVLERRFAALTVEDVLARLSSAGIACGRIRALDEVYGWDQTRSQGLQISVDHATLGPVELPGPPLRFFAVDDGNERETTYRQFRPPPVLDADSERVRCWLAADSSRDGAHR
jgi:crotonobetainyl-CoA:carnitine CoA-transferase CaiB-like acyl-CoA transferase